jgi:hypothetical protein
MMSPIFLFPFSASLFFPFPNSTFDLYHVAARDGERLVAVLDEQLGGAGMRSNLFYLTQVDQEGTMAADNHRVG